MEREQKRLFFRDQLRSARAVALADAEGFGTVVHSLELIGQLRLGKVKGLGEYQKKLSELAAASPFSVEIPTRLPEYHTEFRALYEELKQARNDAVHQGAHARILTDHAVELTIILEDALMVNASKVSQFMVRNVVDAKPWHPISYVRQQMLKYAFSYIPIRLRHNEPWSLLPDASVARYLRHGPKNERNERLARSVSSAVSTEGLLLLKAVVARPEDEIDTILDRLGEGPALIVDHEHEDTLIGVLTASDLL
jgi:hypothetical protein